MNIAPELTKVRADDFKRVQSLMNFGSLLSAQLTRDQQALISRLHSEESSLMDGRLHVALGSVNHIFRINRQLHRLFSFRSTQMPKVKLGNSIQSFKPPTSYSPIGKISSGHKQELRPHEWLSRFLTPETKSRPQSLRARPIYQNRRLALQRDFGACLSNPASHN